MILVFQALAVVLLGAAAYFYYLGLGDAAFVAFALGCSSFFMSVRFQAKARNDARKAEHESKEAIED